MRAILVSALVLLSSVGGYAQELPRLEGKVTLDQAVRFALDHSPMLRAIRKETQMAGAGIKMAQSMGRVQLSTTTSLSAGDSPSILPSSSGVMPGNFMLTPGRGALNQNLTAMLPLSTGGLVRGQVQVAHQKTQEAQAEEAKAQLDLALRVTETYWSGLYAQEMTKAAQARLEAAQALLATTQAQVEAGKGIEASVRRVEAEVADAKRMLASAKNESEKSLIELKAMLGADLDTRIEIQEPEQAADSIAELAMLLKRAQEQRPELVAARAERDVARTRLSLVAASRRPQVYGMAMTDAMATSAMMGRVGYTLGVTASLPLSDGGLRKSQGQEAALGIEKAEAELAEVSLRVQSEVRQAVLDLETARENLTSARSSRDAAQSAYDVTALRVANQKAILVEQLDALATLTQSRTSLAKARFDLALANHRLKRVTGELVNSDGR